MQKDEKKVIVERSKGRVVLKIDGVELSMSPTLARELGDTLYKCGCDAATQAEDA